MTKRKTRNIDLLNGPIFTSLTSLAMPIMATALVQMAYNLTDMAWIGRVGSEAVTAVGTAGMYTWLSQGVVMFARMGGQVKVAHSLGEGDEKEAARYAGGALAVGNDAGDLLCGDFRNFCRTVNRIFRIGKSAYDWRSGSIHENYLRVHYFYVPECDFYRYFDSGRRQ